MNLKNVLILGCGRSGTSILGEFFECFGGYAYHFEPPLDPGNYGSAFQNDGRPIAVKIPRVSEPFCSTFSPGLPFHWPSLAAAFPQPYVLLWIVRHPFDVVCSLQPGIRANWSHCPKPPNWEILNTAPIEARCAAHWLNINGPGFEQVRSQANVIRYEDIVYSPSASARRLATLCGADGDIPEGAHRWIDTIDNRKPGTYEAKHQVRWSEQNHFLRVNRFRENLSPAQRDRLRPLLTPVAAQFGYNLAEPL